MTLDEFLAEWHNDSPTVLVHTSGSTGKPKPMWIEKKRMMASARITCDFLGLKAGDRALLCMSLDYIAGKMMVVRAQTCGLKLVSVKPTGAPSWEGPIDFAAMVPMQVYNLLRTADGRARLRSVSHLIIGGGAIDDGLAQELRSFPRAVWSTYGMTETLSHIALRRLSGPDASEWYTPFDGVHVAQTAEGCLMIDAPAVHEGTLVTNDIVELRGSQFRVLGRKDNVVCSGGIKIQIEEVERLLRPHLHAPFIVTKRKDEKFGEALVLMTEDAQLDAQRQVCQKVLPKYWQPRHYQYVEKVPMTETGKPARKEAERLAALAEKV
ncbi:AMP-binding protein [Prevotella sp. E13-17]|uniref:AMP-binding protein n=1 Tax=Prevotella sp. E13-17 TaxID=2913616 RepID=UPI001EDA2342|nr:AMP-binding protein [Prevotella sp. E13-17]UKK52322.1 AMP-binding protein [Prevotella sp. E13-17]